MDKAALLSKLDLLDQIGIWFAVLAALGTAGLAYVAFAHWSSGKLLQTIEAADKRIHDAAIASAQLDASQANERAAEARLAYLKLEERLKPRSLTRPDLLQSAVSPFPDQTLSIDCDSDQQPLVMQILAAARSAGWNKVGMALSEQERVAPGAALYVSPDADERTAAAAKALADGLRAAGVADLTGPISGSASTGAAANSTITIRIGAKE